MQVDLLLKKIEAKASNREKLSSSIKFTETSAVIEQMFSERELSNRMLFVGGPDSGKASILSEISKRGVAAGSKIATINARNVRSLVYDPADAIGGFLKRLNKPQSDPLYWEEAIEQNSVLILIDDLTAILKNSEPDQKKILKAILVGDHYFDFVATTRFYPDFIFENQFSDEVYNLDASINYFEIQPLSADQARQIVTSRGFDYDNVKEKLISFKSEAYLKNLSLLNLYLDSFSSNDDNTLSRLTRGDIYMKLLKKRLSGFSKDIEVIENSHIYDSFEILRAAGWLLFISGEDNFSLTEIELFFSKSWPEISIPDFLPYLRDADFIIQEKNNTVSFVSRNPAFSEFLLSLSWYGLGMPPSWLCLSSERLLGNWVGLQADLDKAIREAIFFAVANERPDIAFDCVIANNNFINTKTKKECWSKIGHLLASQKRHIRDETADELMALDRENIESSLDFGVLAPLEEMSPKLSQSVRSDIEKGYFTSSRYQYFRRRKNYHSSFRQLSLTAQHSLATFLDRRVSFEVADKAFDVLKPYVDLISLGNIIRLAKDKTISPKRRSMVVSFLGRTNSTKSKPVIKKIFKDALELDHTISENLLLFRKSITALGRLHDESMVAEFRELLLRDGLEQQLYGILVNALGNIRKPESTDAIMDFIAMRGVILNDPRELRGVIRSLGVLGYKTEKVSKFLLNHLSSSNNTDEVRWAATYSLEKLDIDEAVTVFNNIVVNEDEALDVRIACVNGLMSFEVTSYLDQLYDLLEIELTLLLEAVDITDYESNRKSNFITSLIRLLSRNNHSKIPQKLYEIIQMERDIGSLIGTVINLLRLPKYSNQLTNINNIFTSEIDSKIKIRAVKVLLSSEDTTYFEPVITELLDTPTESPYFRDILISIFYDLSKFTIPQIMKIGRLFTNLKSEIFEEKKLKLIEEFRIRKSHNFIPFVKYFTRSKNTQNIRIAAISALMKIAGHNEFEYVKEIAQSDRTQDLERMIAFESVSKYGEPTAKNLLTFLLSELKIREDILRKLGPGQRYIKIRKDRDRLFIFIATTLSRYLVATRSLGMPKTNDIETQIPILTRKLIDFSREVLSVTEINHSDEHKFVSVIFLLEILSTIALWDKKKREISFQGVFIYLQKETLKPLHMTRLLKVIMSLEKNYRNRLLTIIISKPHHTVSNQINAIRLLASVGALDKKLSNLVIQWGKSKQGYRAPKKVKIDTREAIRGRIIKAIGEQKKLPPKVEKYWVHTLVYLAQHDPDSKNRTMACSALSSFGHFSDRLIAKLLGSDSDPGVRGVCAAEIVLRFQIPKGPSGQLLDLLVTTLLDKRTHYAVVNKALQPFNELSFDNGNKAAIQMLRKTEERLLHDSNFTTTPSSNSFFLKKLKSRVFELSKQKSMLKERENVIQYPEKFYRYLRLSNFLQQTPLSVLILAVRPNEGSAMQNYLEQKIDHLSGSTDMSFELEFHGIGNVRIRAVSLNTGIGISSGHRVKDYLRVFDLKADLAILVGCSGGIDKTKSDVPTENKIKLGDVVIGSTIYPIIRRQTENSHEDNYGELQTNDPYTLHSKIKILAESLVQNNSTTGHNVWVGAYLSGNELTNHPKSNRKRNTQLKERSILAKEMEASGFMSELDKRKTKGIVVKGISDFLWGMENDKIKLQQTATINALDTSIALIEKVRKTGVELDE